MTMMPGARILAGSACLFVTIAAAATPPPPPNGGSGPFPAIYEEVPSLPDHVVYRPADPGAAGLRRMPIVVWGNGGCRGDGTAQRNHLLELASHGYLVIANGHIGGEAPPASSPSSSHPGSLPPPQTRATQLTEAIDWALGEAGRAGGPYRSRLATEAIAVSGYSCGGLQALKIAAKDTRVRTVLIHNSGVLPPDQRSSETDVSKDDLARIRAPVLYVLGGPRDIAYANGMDDFRRFDHVPAAVANIDVTHSGTFADSNGGAAARIAVEWLDWQLKGSRTARRWFVGRACGLCRDPRWSYVSKALR